MRDNFGQFILHFRSNPLSSLVAVLLIALLGVVSTVLYHLDVSMPLTMLKHNQAHHLDLQKQLLQHRLQTAIDDLRFVSRITQDDQLTSAQLARLRRHMRKLCKPGDGYLRISGWYPDSGHLVATNCNGRRGKIEFEQVFGDFDPLTGGRDGLQVNRVQQSRVVEPQDEHADDASEPGFLRIIWPVVDTQGKLVSTWGLEISMDQSFRRLGIDGDYHARMLLLGSFDDLVSAFEPGEGLRPFFERAWKHMSGHGIYDNEVGLFLFDSLMVRDPIDQSPVDSFKLVAHVSPDELAKGNGVFIRDLGYVVLGYLLLLTALYFYTRNMLAEKRSMVQELQKQQLFLDSIFDSSADAMITVDLEGAIIGCNSRTNSLFGYEGQPLRQQSMEVLLPSAYQMADIQYPQRYQALLKAKEPFVTEELVGIRSSGAEFPVEVTFCLLQDNRRPCLLLITREITQRKVAEQELDHLRLQYFQQEKMAQIGLLVAGILHEVGNPLAAIRGLLEEVISQDRNLDKPILTDHYRSNLEIVIQQTERIRAISHEISGFASSHQSERELLDLNRIVAGASHLLQYDKRWRSIRLIQDLDPRLPAIEGVADQLTQVFMNLLVNASDAFDDGVAAEPQVTVRTRNLADGLVMLEIVDNGSGIADKDIVHAFDPFYTTKPQGKGTGLGLSICEKLVMEHNGELEIDSRPDEGTTVRIYFTYEPLSFG